MWTKALQHSKDYVVTDYNFNGINIHAAKGIHELSFELFTSLKLNHGAKICVLGAGAGAFDERLYAAGYYDITSLEFNPHIYRSKGKVLAADLNKDFSGIGKFDIVIALEIMEHIENQFDFLRQIKEILNSNGHLILSTPNPKNTFSRFRFMLNGDISYFNTLDITSSGHINPVFDHVLKFYLKEIGFKISSEKMLNVWSMTLRGKKLFAKLVILFAYLVTRFVANKDDRAMLIYLISKI